MNIRSVSASSDNTPQTIHGIVQYTHENQTTVAIITRHGKEYHIKNGITQRSGEVGDRSSLAVKEWRHEAPLGGAKY